MDLTPYVEHVRHHTADLDAVVARLRRFSETVTRVAGLCEDEPT